MEKDGMREEPRFERENRFWVERGREDGVEEEEEVLERFNEGTRDERMGVSESGVGE